MANVGYDTNQGLVSEIDLRSHNTVAWKRNLTADSKHPGREKIMVQRSVLEDELLGYKDVMPSRILVFVL